MQLMNNGKPPYTYRPLIQNFRCVKISKIRPDHINTIFQATQQLLECGAIPDIIDYRNEAPIHLAAENGSNDISEVLLKFGTSVTLKDSKGIRLHNTIYYFSIY